MNFTYEDLLKAQLRFGTTEEDIRRKNDFNMVMTNVVIAPWWEVSIFDNHGLIITKVNDKLYNLKNNEVEFSFIQVKQVGAPAIIEEVLNLGVTRCKNLIFIGSVGSLSKDINIADIVIPKASICGDGASRYLNSDLQDDFGKIENPNEMLAPLLLDSSQKISNNMNIEVHSATNFSVDTVFGQFPHIDKILSMGAETIEMETYCLFKASRIAGIKSSALLCVSDNAIINKSLYSGRTEKDRKLRKKVRNDIIPKVLMECFKEI